MNPVNPLPLSRRQWLEQVAGPALVASLGAGVLGAASAVAQTMPPSSAISRAEGAAPALLGAQVYNVREFGAKGDGVALDTAPVQAAIDACSRDQGGTVLVPAGDFVVGTLELKSNVTLHLA